MADAGKCAYKALKKLIAGKTVEEQLNQAGIYAARDKYGRTPLVIGNKEDSYCLAMESFSFQNLFFLA